MSEENNNPLLPLTVDIVAAHVSNNNVPVGELAGLIQNVHAALVELGRPDAPPAAAPEPAAPIRSSVKPGYIICLEDGKKLKTLKRYLRTTFDMSPEQYRAKWKLPPDYPMVAPSYSAQRRDLALKMELGKKRPPKPAAETLTPTEPRRAPRAKAKQALA